MQLNFWPILFSIACAQGLFLSLLLFLKREKQTDWLASAMLVFSLMLAYYVCYWSGLNSEIPVFLSLTMGFTLLVGPFLYGYIKNQLSTIHFLPYGIYVLVTISATYLELNQEIVYTILAAGQCIHLFVYTALIYKCSRSTWSRFISLAFLGYAVCFSLYYVLVWAGWLRIEYDYMISLASAVLIYAVGYQAILHPDSLRLTAEVKYKNSPLSPTAGKAILGAIKRHMDEQKAYLNNDLKLTSLAAELELSPHHISQAINEYEKCNFSDFINQYRISAAKRLIKEATDKPIFIQIAYDVGFNNKTSFYNAFKKLTKQSPTAYYQSLMQKKMSA